MRLKTLFSLLHEDLKRLSFKDETTGVESRLRTGARGLHPRFVPVLFIRIAQYFYSKPFIKPVSSLFSLLNVVLFGIEVTPRCYIGPGLLLPHTSGTVIGAIEIGSNVTIFQGVTLGATFADLGFDPASRPVLEDDVVVGAGAKVLGGIRIGRKAIIASNTLVIESVPDGCFAIGVPAIIKAKQ
jgi:serine O-acetyltransferase